MHNPGVLQPLSQYGATTNITTNPKQP